MVVTRQERLDHILCTAGLMPRSGDGLRQIPQVSIWNEDTPNILGAHPTAAGVVPDHAPVTANFAEPLVFLLRPRPS